MQIQYIPIKGFSGLLQEPARREEGIELRISEIFTDSRTLLNCRN